MGRLQWLRMDSDLDSLPRAVDAGYGGVSIWLALARVSAQFGLDGRIPPTFGSVKFLAHRLGSDIDRISADLHSAIVAGLVAQDNGDLVVAMDRFDNPDVVRQRRLRDKPSVTVTGCHGLSRDVTVGHATIRDDTLRDDTVRDDLSPCNPPSRGDGSESNDEPKTKPKARTRKHKEPSKVAQAVVAIYHEECPNLPQVRVVNDELDQRINCRYQDLGADVEKVREFFRDIVAPSDFLNNRVHSKDGHGFQASLPWLMGPVNFSKVANGAYQNKRNQYEQRLWELEHDQEAV